MQKVLLMLLVVGILSSMTVYLGSSGAVSLSAAEKDAAGPLVIHNVYFTLKDKSDASQKKMVDACVKYLKPQAGVTYFACGTLAKDLKRPVNDLDWDIGLHVVFKDQAAHDKYQDDPQHLAFIQENKENWAKVRVFDTLGQ